MKKTFPARRYPVTPGGKKHNDFNTVDSVFTVRYTVGNLQKLKIIKKLFTGRPWAAFLCPENYVKQFI